MATFYWQDCKFYLGGYDLSGDHNSLALTHKYEELDNTVFGATVRTRMAGLMDLSFQGGGFWNSDGSTEIDDVLYARFNTADQPATVCPEDGTANSTAYFWKNQTLEYTPLAGAVGELLTFQVNGAASSGRLVRGKVLKTGSVTSTSTSTPYQVGAVTASQYLYACLHVYSVSGTSPTLDVVLQSDNAEAFESAATRITFTQKTAIGSQFATPVAGAITDDWWRLSYTVGGSDTPTFGFIVSMGII